MEKIGKKGKSPNWQEGKEEGGGEEETVSFTRLERKGVIASRGIVEGANENWGKKREAHRNVSRMGTGVRDRKNETKLALKRRENERKERHNTRCRLETGTIRIRTNRIPREKKRRRGVGG
jgi:hypothetical protein